MPPFLNVTFSLVEKNPCSLHHLWRWYPVAKGVNLPRWRKRSSPQCGERPKTGAGLLTANQSSCSP
ncbi:hypothetical protein GOODEAATRI_031764, partial [Goodea atripinnis]